VALLLLPRTGMIRLTERPADDAGSRSKAVVPGHHAPCWVKLTRRGNSFTGAVSNDGNTWLSVGDPVTVGMKSTVLVGLAVTSGSRDESKLHTSAFDQVTVGPVAKTQ
jgi:regulation of enolase protein 1 (concanavalin A-like superfamily)